MPTFTVRVSHDEHGALIARAQRAGQNVSDYVRETLDLRENDDAIQGLNARVEELWRKVARLEQLANLDD